MWVAASQKPMQSLSDLPPPPGLLGADSLGLEGDVAGESARFGEDPPPVANWVGNGSDIGASAGSAGSGVVGAAGPVTGVVVGLTRALARAVLPAGAPGNVDCPGIGTVTLLPAGWPRGTHCGPVRTTTSFGVRGGKAREQ
jgi:hypothetical protein